MAVAPDLEEVRECCPPGAKSSIQSRDFENAVVQAIID
jgi:hypothetical protein